jgi:hypothetical protein
LIRWTFPQSGIKNQNGGKFYNYEYQGVCKGAANYDGGLAGWGEYSDNYGVIGLWKLEILFRGELIHKEEFNITR